VVSIDCMDGIELWRNREGKKGEGRGRRGAMSKGKEKS